MSKKVNVFLPLRLGSTRVPNKNTRLFAGVEGGLCRIKLEQLLQCKFVAHIYVSTNDPTVEKITNELKSEKIKVILRPSELASPSSSTDQLIKYVPEIMPDGHILWTHVTSPLITAEVYDEIICSYFKHLDDNDSLMSVTKIQKFMWDSKGALNYDRELHKWPQTQDLPALWEINSGAFVASKNTYIERLDRIGVRPFLYELKSETALDIDHLGDFRIAEILYSQTHTER